GIFKVIFIIAVSTVFAGDALTPTGLAGLALSMAGISLYTFSKLPGAASSSAGRKTG
ncbi:hypothetical protein HK405_000459, partial [Cladochytrium tenue]